jgi:hypothetical protein
MFLLLVSVSCSSDKYKASLPAYLDIQGFELQTDFTTEGTAHSNFTTVWVFYDNEAIGAFDLPCTVPIIPKPGAHELLLYPGITMNGIDASRAIYSMCEPVTQSVTLNPLDTFRFNNGIPVTQYTATTQVSLVEDFDKSGVNLEPTQSSDTSVVLISDSANTFHFPGENNGRSGLLTITPDMDRVEIVSSDAYTLPRGRDVYLEITYKSNNSLLIGVVANETVQVPRSSVLLFSTNNVWKKAYINYINEIGPSNEGTAFNVLFGALRDDGVDTAKIYIDNLKLVYR